jgi:hypothetical protein
MRSVASSPPPLGPKLRNETKFKIHQVFGNVQVEE